MSALEPASVQCPYCWEILEILVDPSVPEQSYVEDCQVCCQPILMDVAFDPQGLPLVTAQPEND